MPGATFCGFFIIYPGCSLDGILGDFRGRNVDSLSVKMGKNGKSTKFNSKWISRVWNLLFYYFLAKKQLKFTNVKYLSNKKIYILFFYFLIKNASLNYEGIYS